MAGTNVAGIYGEISLDNRGFRQVLSQSKSDMAKAALDMQRSSRVKVDLSEWKKLSAQMGALQQRAQETRVKLNQAFQHGGETKALQTELRNLQTRLKLLKDTAEPARKELERLSKAGRDVPGAARGGGAMKGIGGAVTSALPGNLGGMLSAGGGNPYVMAATAAIAGMTAAAAAAMKAATATGEYAEEINNLAQKTGMGTDRLQELKAISENAGLSFDTVTTAITQVQRKLMGMEEGSGPAAEAMQRLGINIKDSNGQLRSMDSLFPELLKKLQSMTNVSERNMLAAQIFGRGFGELAPLLGMTAAEFENATKQANALGVVMSADALQKAAAFDDQMDELRETLVGVWREVGTAVIPVFSSLAKQLLEAWPAIRKAASEMWAQIKPMFSAMWEALKAIWEIIGPVVRIMAGEKLAEAVIVVKALALAFEGVAWVLKQIKELLQPLLDGLKWIADHAPKLLGLGGGSKGKEIAAASTSPAGGLHSEVPDQGPPSSATSDIPYIPRTEKRKSLIGNVVDVIEQAAQARAKALQDMLDEQRDWARKIVDSQKQAGRELLDEVKSQLHKEQEARDQAMDKARSRYEKLAEIGNLGARAMTAIAMFKKPESQSDITAADITPDRVSEAAAAIRGNKANQAAMENAVNGQLFGGVPGRLDAIANTPNPQGNVVQQVSLLTQIVATLSAQLRELQKLTLKPVTT